MTEIRFYHLSRTKLEQALPQILGKAYESGKRVVVRCASAEEAEALADHLWVFDVDKFLPHGTAKDGHAAEQPIWLTAANDVPNSAKIAVTVCGEWPQDPAQFDLCCDVFSDDGKENARQRWAAFKDSGHTLTYWQQTDKGWEKKV